MYKHARLIKKDPAPFPLNPNCFPCSLRRTLQKRDKICLAGPPISSCGASSAGSSLLLAKQGSPYSPSDHTDILTLTPPYRSSYNSPKPFTFQASSTALFLAHSLLSVSLKCKLCIRASPSHLGPHASFPSATTLPTCHSHNSVIIIIAP